MSYINKYSLKVFSSHIIGFLKGKAALYIARSMDNEGNMEATLFGLAATNVSEFPLMRG
ncbi:MAG: hypothetical protein K2X28_08680 [Alphaproteobacteria bacterium]|nr:hypothetical protein [Alphaproteobacteria bacterium]